MNPVHREHFRVLPYPFPIASALLRRMKCTCIPSWWLGCLALMSLGMATRLSADEIQKVNELGPVHVTTTLSPSEPIIGDEIQLEIRVKAAADIEVLMPEFGEALNRYSILDFVPRQRMEDDGAQILIQRYTLQPNQSGPQAIPPILIEFVDHRDGKPPAPKDADAYELLTDRINFEVKSVVPTGASPELKPPLGRLEPPRTSMRPLGWMLILVAVIVVVAGVILFVWWRSNRQHRLRRTAYEIARQKLDQLLAKPLGADTASIESFFVTISLIVRKYLEDRFGLHAPDLTTEEFLQLASQTSELTSEHRQLLQRFLKQADLVKFAGAQVTPDEIQRSSEAASRFLEETRENAPLLEVPETEPSVATSISSQIPQEDAHV